MGGDHDRAQRRLDAALALGRALAAKAMLTATQAGLGEVALARGQAEAAAACYRAGLTLGRESGYRQGMAFNLQGLVRVGSCRGGLERTARVIGALDAFGRAMHAMPGAVAAAYEAAVARVRGALGEEAFTAARAAGQAMPLGEAVAEALALANETTAVGSQDGSRPGPELFLPPLPARDRGAAPGRGG